MDGAKPATLAEPLRVEKRRRASPSPEALAKRAASMKAAWERRKADPETMAKFRAAQAEGFQRLANDPVKSAERSARSSAHMARLHQTPEFQERRNARSSRVAKRNWENPAIRARLTDCAVERYQAGKAIASDEAKRKKAEASRWILREALKEFRASTDYNAVYAAVQAEIRQSMPYDGPTDHAYYQEYLGKLGRAVVSDPRLRSMQDSFMVDAIPRWAAKWAERKSHSPT